MIQGYYQLANDRVQSLDLSRVFFPSASVDRRRDAFFHSVSVLVHRRALPRRIFHFHFPTVVLSPWPAPSFRSFAEKGATVSQRKKDRFWRERGKASRYRTLRVIFEKRFNYVSRSRHSQRSRSAVLRLIVQACFRREIKMHDLVDKLFVSKSTSQPDGTLIARNQLQR